MSKSKPPAPTNRYTALARLIVNIIRSETLLLLVISAWAGIQEFLLHCQEFVGRQSAENKRPDSGESPNIRNEIANSIMETPIIFEVEITSLNIIPPPTIPNIGVSRKNALALFAVNTESTLNHRMVPNMEPHNTRNKSGCIICVSD